MKLLIWVLQRPCSNLEFTYRNVLFECIRNGRLVLMASLLSVVFCCPTFVNGQASDWEQTQKVIPPDAGNSDFIGGAVAILNNVAIVGTGSQGSSKAYGYRFVGGSWQLGPILESSNPSTSDDFGSAVAVSGTHFWVGAGRESLENGAVYIFDMDGSLVQKLTPPGPAEERLFGCSVALTENLAIIGALGDAGQGAAYVYSINEDGTATFDTRLTASDGEVGDGFGVSVSISGNTAIVGSYLDEDNGPSSGSAYIFTYEGGVWEQTKKIFPSIAREGDQFGVSVSISGNYAIVGSPFSDAGFSGDAGAAYIYRFNGNGWGFEQRLTGLGRAGDKLGTSVSISGTSVIAGAIGNDTRRGAIFFYERGASSWMPYNRLIASDRAPNDAFGTAVSISGPKFVAGAVSDDALGLIDNGSAYFFALPDQIPPVISAVDVTLDTDEGECGADLSVEALIAEANVMANDDNDGPLVPTLSVDGDPIVGNYPFPLGSTTVTVMAEDAAGNAAEELFTVSVVDNAPPVFEPVDDLLRSPEKKQDGATITYELPVASDNCGLKVPPVLSAGLGSGAFFPIGTTTETYTATDVNGNSSSISFTVTISNDLGIVSFDLIPVGKQKKVKKPKKGELPTNPNSIQPLESGAVIDLADPATEAFSIGANVNRKAGSVVFLLNGDVIKTDNKAPYSATEDAKVVAPLDIAPGDYVLEAIPYADPDGTGEAGFSLVVSFQVIDSNEIPAARLADEHQPMIDSHTADDRKEVSGAISRVYPNPVRDHLTVEIFSAVVEKAQVTWLDMSGKKLYATELLLQKGPNALMVDLPNMKVPAGVSILTVQTVTQGQMVHRLLMSRD